MMPWSILAAFLPALITAQSCVYEGRTYSNLAIFDHTNGCAKFQCQKGNIIAVVESCGRDVDGECHYLGSQYVHNEVFYRCIKRIENYLPVYKNEVLPPFKPPGCSASGIEYDNLEIFTQYDGCKQSQCQAGTIVNLTPFTCNKKLDGECHYLGSWATKTDKVYKCTVNTVNGITANDYVPLSPQPDICGSCTSDGKKYNILDVFTDGCNTFQCQDNGVVTLTEVCKFPSNGKCYTLNTQWQHVDKVYECVKNPDGSLTHKVVPPTLRSCTLGSRTYPHLTTVKAQNGCQINQCLNGRFVVVHAACSDRRGTCRPLNTIWVDGEDTFQCSDRDNDWGIGVVRITENNVPVPICEKPGKDVMYILDNSGSIQVGNFSKQKNFTTSLVGRFYIGLNTTAQEFLFGAITFATQVTKLFDLNRYLTRSSLQTALKSVHYTGGWTYTNLAFDYIVNNKLFNKGRDEAPNIVLLLTDGDSTKRTLTLAAAKRLRDSGCEIIAVGVGAANDQELIDITGNPQNVFHVDNFDVLYKVEEKLSYRVCTVPSK